MNNEKNHLTILILSLFVGFSGLISQLVIVKEIFSVFFNNELLLGFFLANWLIVTASGNFLIKHFPAKIIFSSIIFLIFISLIALPLEFFFISYLRSSLVLVGNLSLLLICGDIFLSLMLSALSLGALFSATIIYAKENKVLAEKIYFYETLGAFIASILYIFLLLNNTLNYKIAYLNFWLGFLCLGLLLLEKKKYPYLIIFTTLFFISLLVNNNFNLKQNIFKLAYQGEKILKIKDTPYGKLIITKRNKQINFYESGIPLFASQDNLLPEKSVHFALSENPQAKKVLILGFVNGITNELQKYSLKQIDYVEINPEIIKQVKKYFIEKNNLQVNYFYTDIRYFINKTNNKYDVILLNTPEPANLQFNRFYTLEFFKQIKKILNKNGVFSFYLNGSEVYEGREIQYLHSSIYNALKKIFKNIFIIPGEKTFYLSSDTWLKKNILEIISHLNIKTKFINKNYLATNFSEEKLQQAKKQIIKNISPNTDFYPSAYTYNLKLFLKKTSPAANLLFYFFLIFVVILFLIFNTSENLLASTLIASSGFTLMSLQVLMIFLLQIFVGAFFLQISILFTVSFLGLSTGAYLINKKLANISLLKIEIIFLATIFLNSIIIFITKFFIFNLNLLQIIFISCLFFISILSGIEFQFLFAKKQNKFNLYAADLLGAGVGAITIAIILIPNLGIIKTLGILLIIKMLNFPLAYLEQKNYLILPANIFKQKILILVFLLILFSSAFLSIDNFSKDYVYALSFHKTYLTIIFLSLFLGVLFAFKINFLQKMQNWWFNLSFIYLKTTQVINYFIFLPVAFFPAFRCYFKIPYIFCQVCPRQCIFGYLRLPVFWGGVATNQTKFNFCNKMCPVGTLGDCQNTSKINFKIKKFLNKIRKGVLILIIFIYGESFLDKNTLTYFSSSIYVFMFKNEFSFSLSVFLVFLFFIILGFFIKRPFCNLLCPLGELSEIIQTNINKKAKQSG